MASEARALVEQIYEGWSRGDYSRADWAHPEIEFEIPDGPERGSWQGREQMAEVWREYLGAWRDLRVRPERIVESGDEILVIGRFEGSGRASGVPLAGSQRASQFRVRDGMVVRLVLWNDVERALEEFGS